MINDQLSRPSADWEGEDAPLKMKESLFNPASFLNSTHSSVNPILRGLCNDMSLKGLCSFYIKLKKTLLPNKPTLCARSNKGLGPENYENPHTCIGKP